MLDEPKQLADELAPDASMMGASSQIGEAGAPGSPPSPGTTISEPEPGGGSGGASDQPTRGSLPRTKGAGPCGSTFVDMDCDATMTACPAGQHRDFTSGPCSECVPDTRADRSCAWGRERYGEFLAELTSASCADFCQSDADCRAFTLSNSCAESCSIALYGFIDEEVLWAAEEFAKESCDPFCAGTPRPLCPKEERVRCVDNRCRVEAAAN